MSFLDIFYKIIGPAITLAIIFFGWLTRMATKKELTLAKEEMARERAIMQKFFEKDLRAVEERLSTQNKTLEKEYNKELIMLKETLEKIEDVVVNTNRSINDLLHVYDKRILELEIQKKKDEK